MEQLRLNAFERAIMLVSPSWALSRERSRLALTYTYNVRKYSGAGQGPLAYDWMAKATSSMAEINRDLPTLRNRMRDLVRNDGWANRAVKVIANNVVGTGIQANFTGPEALKNKAEEFTKWCKSKNADFYGKLNFYGIEWLVIATMAQSGDTLMLKRWVGKGKKMKLAIQVLEADYIVEWYNEADAKGFDEGAYCERGIYYSGEGRVIGYRLYKAHPGNDAQRGNSVNTVFVSAEDCELIYRIDRPGQNRGVPEGHSIMLEHKMLGQYELAQAHKQTVSASYAVFVTSMQSMNVGKDNNGKMNDGKEYTDLNAQEISPGTIYNLLPGEDITFANPPTTGDYDPYTKNRLRKIAVGYGISYEALSGDLKQVNFTSGRMGWLEMHRNIEGIQDNVLIPQCCETVWNWWLQLEQLKGTMPFEIDGLNIDWTKPRREMIDPVKETNAMIAQVKAGFMSLPEAIRKMGRDPMQVFKEIAENNLVIDGFKLIFSSDYRKEYEAKTKFKEIKAKQAEESKGEKK